jgi:hypothetical protein
VFELLRELRLKFRTQEPYMLSEIVKAFNILKSINYVVKWCCVAGFKIITYLYNHYENDLNMSPRRNIANADREPSLC